MKDLITSDQISVTRLDQIFRQGKGSRIVTNAHRINKGYFPDVDHEKGSDFAFFQIEDSEEILGKTLELIQKHIPSRTKLHPIDEVQVLCPVRRGTIGADNFNQVLQEQLNPQELSISRMGKTFHLHDKVMQIRNNKVSFDGVSVSYHFNEIDELDLAYAVLIHKYQGSECPCEIIPVHTSHYRMLFRNLLYTGVTRGKKLVILLGTKKSLFIAVETDHAQTRYTGLKSLMLKSFCVF